jgi:hypothetical protein
LRCFRSGRQKLPPKKEEKVAKTRFEVLDIFFLEGLMLLLQLRSLSWRPKDKYNAFLIKK